MAIWSAVLLSRPAIIYDAMRRPCEGEIVVGSAELTKLTDRDEVATRRPIAESDALAAWRTRSGRMRD